MNNFLCSIYCALALLISIHGALSNPKASTSSSLNSGSIASLSPETANETATTVLKDDIKKSSLTTSAKNKRRTSPAVSKEGIKISSPTKKRRKNETAEKQKLSKSSTQASTSLRRIKKEYESAVKMGICYDWAKKRLVPPKTIMNPSSVSPEHQKLICLGPLASNLRHWHFSFRGCGVYDAGIYHGRILLPKDYPSTPPHVQLWTPSGRFVPYHDICLSASSYHPESWSPRWTVLSLVQALRLHMLTNPQEIGGKSSTREVTLEYAKESLTWNLSFHAGKLIISVDHALLLRQGILSLTDDDAGENEAGEIKEDDDEATNSKEKEDSSSSAVGGDNKTFIVPLEKLDTPPDGPSIAFKPKTKRKKRKGKHTKGGSSTVITKRKKQVQQRVKPTLLHSVILILAKVLGSPLKLGFLFGFLFFCYR